jgi:hypothetical protein
MPSTEAISFEDDEDDVVQPGERGHQAVSGRNSGTGDGSAARDKDEDEWANAL